MKKITLLTLTLALLGAMSIGAQAQILSDFTFESLPTSTSSFTGAYTPTPSIADINNTGASSTVSVYHVGSSAYTAPAGNGSAKSLSSTVWAVGDYYQFTVNTMTTNDLFMTFDQYSSGTGPGTFNLTYSTDGVNFATAATYSFTTSMGSFAGASSSVNANLTHSYDLSGIAAINGNGTSDPVTFRLVDANTFSAAAGTGLVGTGGTDRVDNVIFSNGALVPEPATWAMMLGGLLFLGFLAKRRTAKV